MKRKTFVLSSSRVNSYGFRLLTSGAELERFKANPVMLYNHKRGVDSARLPIGKWMNIRIEGDQLLADADFDMTDEFAVRISKKVENGVLRAASVGFDPIEVSAEPSDMLAGQTLPTVTKWSPFEASIVDLPSNEDALALMHEGELIVLDKDFDFSQLSFLSKNSNPTIKNQLKMKEYPKELLTLLGLGADATDIQVMAAVQALNKKATDAEAAKTTAETALTDALSKDVVADIEAQAIVLKMDAAQKTDLLALAKTNPTLAKSTLAMIAPRETLQTLSKAAAGKAGNPEGDKGRDAWTYSDWSKKDSTGLLAMKTADNAKFEALLSAQLTANRENMATA